MNKDYKRILITRTDRIGDVILSTPVIKALRDNLPKSHIAMMVSPVTREIVEGNPYLDEVIVMDKKGKQSTLSGTLDLVSSLRKRKFDLALILHGTARIHLLTFLAGIPERIGYDRKLPFLLTKQIPYVKYQGLKHELEYCLDLVRKLGFDPKEKQTYFPLNVKAEEKVNKIFREHIHPKHPVVAIHPGASCPSRRWMPERFAEVTKKIIDDFKANIIIIGAGEKELHICKNLSGLISSSHVLDLSGELSLLELGSVLRRCDLLISNDSGPVHIAAAVGTTVISIFSRSQPGLSPQRWRPLSENSFYIHRKVNCKVCLAHNCKKGFACLRAISVDDVYQTANKILKKQKI